jgi:outer membrane protein assembly factor BamA
VRTVTRLQPPTAALLVALAMLSVARLAAQKPRATGLEVGGVPALNFNSDEGFGYGVIAELYQYGDGTQAPWVWTLQPKIFLTTGGRRDFTLFFDAPHVLPGGWRIGIYLASEQQIATPYYGVGNATLYDAARDAEDGPDPYYYRFGRTRRGISTDLQHPIFDPRLRALIGLGISRVSVVPVPKNEGNTLFGDEWGREERAGWFNYGRVGLVWDTRDRETDPRRGAWTELLVQRVDHTLGADADYTRWTFADRRYLSLTRNLVFAHRVLLQNVSAGAPVYELFAVQTSFKQQEGLGGANTLRGIPKDRYVGRGLLVWNAELRWRAADFRMLDRPFHVTLSAFLDQGRVWKDGIRIHSLLADLHRGVGGGIRLGMGEDFVVAADAGTSSEASLPIYIGLGYLF